MLKGHPHEDARIRDKVTEEVNSEIGREGYDIYMSGIEIPKAICNYESIIGGFYLVNLIS